MLGLKTARSIALEEKECWATVNASKLGEMEMRSTIGVLRSGARSDFGRGCGAPGQHGVGAVPDQLDACENGNGGDDEFEPARREDASDGATQEDARHATCEELREH